MAFDKDEDDGHIHHFCGWFGGEVVCNRCGKPQPYLAAQAITPRPWWKRLLGLR